jgi:beta-phosphoglucomutase-like phosphatase (HAD superfamily)
MILGSFNNSSRYTVEKIPAMVMVFDMAVLLRPDLAKTKGTHSMVYGAKDLLNSFKRQGHSLSVVSHEDDGIVDAALKDSRLLDFFEDRVYPDRVLSVPSIYKPVLMAVKADDRGNILFAQDEAVVRAGVTAGLMGFAFADSALHGLKTDLKRRALERAGAVLVAETLGDFDTLLAARTLPSRMKDNWAIDQDNDGFDGPQFS